MIIELTDLEAEAELYTWPRTALVDEVLGLRAQLAEKDRWARVARAALDEGLSGAGGAASLRPA